MVVHPGESDRDLVLVIGSKSSGSVVGCEDDEVPPLPLIEKEHVVIGDEAGQLGRPVEECPLQSQNRVVIDPDPRLAEEPDGDRGDRRRNRLEVRNDEQMLVPRWVAPPATRAAGGESSAESRAHRLEHRGVAIRLGWIREAAVGDDVVRPERDRAHVSPGREARRRTSPPCGA